MATQMLKKFDKYQGTLGDVNKLSLNVVVLHPHYKLDYVALIFEHGYEFDKVQSLTKDVKHFSSRLYEFYKESGTCNSDISK